MKKIGITAMLLAVAMMARAFDFSVSTPQQQVLYYTIIQGTTTVKVVAPDESEGWDYVGSPTGRLQIPSTVSYGGTNYSVTAIDKKAFLNCDLLTAVTIPSTVTTIGVRAFANCTALTSAVMEEGLQNIDMLAFSSCTSLDTIVLPTTLTRIAMSVFDNTGYVNNMENWSSTLTLSIGPWLIRAANTVPGEIVVSEGIMGVANNAFYYCRYLQGVTLPSTIRYIGDAAFQQCQVLDTVRLLSVTPPALGSDAFQGVPSVTVVVPCNSLENYSAAPSWGSMSLLETACPPTFGIEGVTHKGELMITPINGGVMVSNAQGRPLRIYDAQGRCVSAVQTATDRQSLPLPTAGIYVILCEGVSQKFSYSK